MKRHGTTLLMALLLTGAPMARPPAAQEAPASPAAPVDAADGLPAVVADLPAAREGAPTAPGGAGAPGQEREEGQQPGGDPGTGEFRLTAARRLDFHARNLDVAEAFAQLRLLVKRNIVVSPDVQARFTGDLYGLTLEETLEAVCRSTGLQARYEDSFVYIEPDRPTSRIFRLRYVPAEDLVELVRPLLSRDGSVSATARALGGIGPSQDETGGGDYAHSDILVAWDYSANLEAVAELVEALDARPQQVLIEATIMSADLTDDLSAGIDFTALLGVDFEDVGGTSSDGTSLDIAGFSSSQLDSGAGKAETGLLDQFPAGGLNVGYLKNGVAAFVRAVQQVTNTTILANPRVVTLNKQRGEVLLGRRDGYLTSIVTQTSTTQKVEFLETGTRLIFRPFVGEDGYVRLEIHPEDSDGGVNAEGLPFKDTAEVTTNVLVRSGQTVVIGGLFRERTEELERRVPWLGDLPLLGLLFRSTRSVSVREEIIVLLTPTILDAADDQLALGAPALDELVDGDELGGVYLHTARRLLERGACVAALVFLDAGNALGPERVDSQALRRKAVRELTPTLDERRSVDALILQSMLEDPLGQRLVEGGR